MKKISLILSLIILAAPVSAQDCKEIESDINDLNLEYKKAAEEFQEKFGTLGFDPKRDSTSILSLFGVSVKEYRLTLGKLSYRKSENIIVITTPTTTINTSVMISMTLFLFIYGFFEMYFLFLRMINTTPRMRIKTTGNTVFSTCHISLFSEILVLSSILSFNSRDRILTRPSSSTR